ncbi:MAG: DUF4910 domain-containing protein [Syntrophomonas sp.]
MTERIKKMLKEDLIELCVKNSDRHVGSERNQRAVSYAGQRMASQGLLVEQPQFACMDWEYGNIVLEVGSVPVQAVIGPYSTPCDIRCPFETASTVEQLKSRDFTGKIAVLYGELCREQLMAKNFIFYNPDHHKEIVSLLEQKNPRAVVAITGKNPEMAGAVYPFPLIEDGDFDIPVANVPLEEGEKLLCRPGMEIHLCLDSVRIPSTGCNVVAVKRGEIADRIVFCAHIDTKKGTPGAVDNAGGVSVLLGLAGLLQDYCGKYTIELLINNGEDYYAYSGGMKYLADNKDNFSRIVAAINADGVGLQGSRTTYCSFNASEALDKIFRNVYKDSNKFREREPWYQSDHMLFAMNGCPALALTTEDFDQAWATIAHTAQDTIDLVDIDILADNVLALKMLIDEMNRNL